MLKKVICQECVAEGKLSRVEKTETFTTAARVSSYYDEVGDYHYHDGNITRIYWRCSNGHRWDTQRTPICPTCKK
jgi:hypothetical protein